VFTVVYALHPGIGNTSLRKLLCTASFDIKSLTKVAIMYCLDRNYKKIKK